MGGQVDQPLATTSWAAGCLDANLACGSPVRAQLSSPHEVAYFDRDQQGRVSTRLHFQPRSLTKSPKIAERLIDGCLVLRRGDTLYGSLCIHMRCIGRNCACEGGPGVAYRVPLPTAGEA